MADEACGKAVTQVARSVASSDLVVAILLDALIHNGVRCVPLILLLGSVVFVSRIFRIVLCCVASRRTVSVACTMYAVRLSIALLTL